MDAPTFSVEVTKSDLQVCVTCSGEFDLAVADRFREAVDESLAGQPRAVHFDCSGVAFIDSIGMRALMHAATQCRDLGIAMTIDMSPRMRRVFDTVGVTALFNLAPTNAVEACEAESLPA
jgi:anti-sigma B factor antagonist